jgi:hypothetical protein
VLRRDARFDAALERRQDVSLGIAARGRLAVLPELL